MKPKQEPVWSSEPSASSEQKEIHPGQFVSEPVTHEVIHGGGNYSNSNSKKYIYILNHYTLLLTVNFLRTMYKITRTRMVTTQKPPTNR